MYFTLLSKKDLTPTIKSYTFAADEAFAFKPGQFVQLKQPGAPQKLARAFSCASAPTDHEVTFLMKHIQDGHVSGFLADAPIGTKLESTTAIGRFMLDPTDIERIFVATGTGIAPIISFVASESEQISQIPTHILFGVRSEANLFWTEKLPAGTLVTLSQPTENWNGLFGRVTTHTSALIAAHPNATWYICGNPEMVKEVRAQLIAAQTPSTSIHFEIY